MKRSMRTSGFIWILPALIVSAGIIYYCIGYTGYISTLKWDGVSPDQVAVGFANYIQAFADPVFWMSMSHTIVFFLATFVGQVFIGLLCALLLHSKVRFGAVYKVLVFLPVVLAPATMAPVFRQIYAPDGQFNGVLKGLGLGFLQQPWLGQTSTSLPVIISIAIWGGVGVAFILYFAAMSQIDNEVLEAARIDGAGNIRTVVSIIWPGLRGTTVAIAILTAISSLKTFDIPWLVSQGGPSYSTEFLGTMIYREGVPLNAVGYAAALSVLLLILAVTIAIVLRLGGRERGVANV